VAHFQEKSKEEVEAYFHFWSRILDFFEYCFTRLRISSHNDDLGRIMFSQVETCWSAYTRIACNLLPKAGSTSDIELTTGDYNNLPRKVRNIRVYVKYLLPEMAHDLVQMREREKLNEVISQ